MARQFNLIPPVCEQAEYHLFQREKVEVQLPELYHKIGKYSLCQCVKMSFCWADQASDLKKKKKTLFHSLHVQPAPTSHFLNLNLFCPVDVFTGQAKSTDSTQT